MEVKKEKKEKKEKKKKRRGGARAAYQGWQLDCRRRQSDWTTERAEWMMDKDPLRPSLRQKEKEKRARPYQQRQRNAVA